MRIFTLTLLFGISAFAPFFCASTVLAQSPTAEQYVASVGGGAKLVPAGKLRIRGKRMICGRRPTVLDSSFADYGGAYPGFLILNMSRMDKLPRAIQWWIFSHECAHQFRGPSEKTADCFAVQRGRRQGWLNDKGIKQICEFIWPAKADGVHASGSERCKAMKQCFASKTVY